MIWVRKGLVWLLSLLLFIALLDGVLAASIDIALSHPAKLENWLNQSGLYSSFVTTALKQADSSTNNGNQSNGVSLSDTAVQQAAESTFSPSFLQKDVNTFLDSNYAWLEGKTATPNFTIDLSLAKQNFAQQVGEYVETHVAGLPVCTTAQAIIELQTSDPLSLTCRPANLNPTVAGTQVTQQLAGNNGFLGNTVITANTLSPNKSGNSKPYYKQFSFAPKIYQLATKLPWALATLAALCTAGIIFIAPSKRKGLRRIAYILTEVGIILVIVKFLSTVLFKKFENTLFNEKNNGALQYALTNFVQRLETQLNNVNFYFGIAMLILALVIVMLLLSTRKHLTKPGKPIAPSDQTQAKATALPTNTAPTQFINGKPVMSDVRGPSGATTKVADTTTPQRTKRPRLIQ